VDGEDLFGAPQKATVPVSGIGALLVLKLNAFAGRQQAKDAYDVLLGVSRFVKGPDAAITEFQAEADASNRGYARAVETLRRHFFEATHSSPLRCAAFALDGQPGIDDREIRERQIIEQLVTIGRALAGEG
jgi:predicted nucleotidyltransferase